MTQAPTQEILAPDRDAQTFQEFMRCESHALDPIVRLYQPGVAFLDGANEQAVKSLLTLIPNSSLGDPEVLEGRGIDSQRVHPERLASFTRDVVVAAVSIYQQPHATADIQRSRLEACAKLLDACIPEGSRATVRAMVENCAKNTRRSTDLRIPLDQKHHIADTIEEFSGCLAKPSPKEKAALVFDRFAGNIEAIKPTEVTKTLRTGLMGAAASAALLVSQAAPAAAAGNNDTIVVIDNQKDPMVEPKPSIPPSPSSAPTPNPIPTPTSFDDLAKEAIGSNNGEVATPPVPTETPIAAPTPTPVATPSSEQTIPTIPAQPIPTVPATTLPTPNVTPAPSEAPQLPVPSDQPASSESPYPQPVPSSVAPEPSPTFSPAVGQPTPVPTPLPGESSPPTLPPSEIIPIPSPEATVPVIFQSPTESEENGIDFADKIFGAFIGDLTPTPTTPADASAEQPSSPVIAPDLTDPSVIAAEQQALLPPDKAGIAANIPFISGAIVAGEAAPTPEESSEAAIALAGTIDRMVTIMTPVPPPSEPVKDAPPKAPPAETPPKNESPEKMTVKEMQIEALHNLAENDPKNWKNRAYVMEYLLERTDLDIIQVSGLIGNFCKEVGSCDIDPATHQKGGPAIGMAQWDDRKDELLAFAKKHDMPWTSVKLQAMFIVHELMGSENRAYRKLLEAKTLRDAANIVLNFYERPAARILTPRYNYAKDTYGDFKKEYDSIAEKQQAKEAPEPPKIQEALSFDNPQLITYITKNTVIPHNVEISEADAKRIAKHYGADFHGMTEGYDHGRKLDIFIAKVPEKYARNDRERELNVRVLGTAIEIVKQAREEGIKLTIGSSYRTNAEQKQFRLAAQCKPGVVVCPNHGDPKQVAIPKYSNHQEGLAVDFSEDGDAVSKLSTFKLLVKIGKKLGFEFIVDGERWHGAMVRSARKVTENNVKKSTVGSLLSALDDGSLLYEIMQTQLV